MQADFPLDPANPDLPGEEPPEPMPVFIPDREISLEGDIAALEFGLETERISRELYAQGAQETGDARARQAYQFLVGQEEEHSPPAEHSRVPHPEPDLVGQRGTAVLHRIGARET